MLTKSSFKLANLRAKIQKNKRIKIQKMILLLSREKILFLFFMLTTNIITVLKLIKNEIIYFVC